ncbi:MAG: V-type ATP synthase subunit B, partial [Spirochaetaceae bacterium]|nr:V-type ATP synthase subunit B [Spirochaetaceae bacterium]
EHRGLSRAEGPLVFAARREGAAYGELVAVYGRDGARRLGRVVDASEGVAAVQLFSDNAGLSLDEARIEYLGRPLELRVGEGLLGRVFDGLGRPADGFPEIVSSEKRDVNGRPLNPAARIYPRDFIQTGVSAIDGMNTLIRGQKLPIFSGNGLPHNRLAAQIVRQARILRRGADPREQGAAGPADASAAASDAGAGGEEPFAVVFAGMGIKHDVARFFIDSFERSGVLARVVAFLSLADAPSIERLVTPRAALTAAEYLAYELGMHVLVVMTDMTNYCEALREVSAAQGEVPSRKGYPGYLYSDLASLYERAGRIESSPGSITQIPILSMPNDDISHPIPDLTGYITEGQIVLERELFQKGVYPPVAGLPSLSRLMKDGIGPGMTREDHRDLSSQLFAAYARVRNVRNLAAIIGEEELSPLDKRYLRFGERFEADFLAQGEGEDRGVAETLDLGWRMLTLLPREELLRVPTELMERYLPKEPAGKRACADGAGAAGAAVLRGAVPPGGGGEA